MNGGHEYKFSNLLKENGQRIFYKMVEMEPFEDDKSKNNTVMSVGDFVEILRPQNDDELCLDIPQVWVTRVEEIYKNKDRKGYFFKGHWMYTFADLQLVVHPEGRMPFLALDKEIIDFDPRQLFLSAGEDNDSYEIHNSLDCIKRKVKVKFLYPSEKPPEVGGEYDYWCSMSYNSNFNTFLSLDPKWRPDGFEQKKVLKALDLYCGCGGLSFACQQDENFSIQPTFAVDHDPDAIQTYKINHQETQVFNMSAKVFLENCLIHQRKLEKFLDNAEKKNLNSKKRKIKIENMITKDGETYVKSNEQILYPIQNVDKECIKKFLMSSNTGTIRYPSPGDVDIIIGGPPCQGLSGLNRFIPKEDILEHSDNSQVIIYLRIVAYFQPDFIILENITSMFTKEDARYAKHIVTNLVCMGYQLRTGIMFASCYGQPQNRPRGIIVAAKAGHATLPSFPHPTVCPILANITKNTIRSRFLNSKEIYVLPTSETILENKLYPPCLLKDVYTDLPEISIWSMAEAHDYASDPVSPYQIYWRRPVTVGTPFEDRKKQLCAQMSDIVSKRVNNWKELKKIEDPVQRNNELFNTVHKITTSMTPEMKMEVLEQMSDEQKAKFFSRIEKCKDDIGNEILKEIDIPIFPENAMLLNHKSITFNLSDALRIRLIPNEGPFEKRCLDDIFYRKGKKPKLVDVTELNIEVTAIKMPRDKHFTYFFSNFDKVVPNWVENVKSFDSVFGRLNENSTMNTINTHSTPGMNVCNLHPKQDRWISIRETARVQGFPDYFCFYGSDFESTGSVYIRAWYCRSRYKQIGNSVSPSLAMMLGKSVLAALNNKSDPYQPLVMLRDEHLDEAFSQAKQLGIQAAVLELGIKYQNATRAKAETKSIRTLKYSSESEDEVEMMGCKNEELKCHTPEIISFEINNRGGGEEEEVVEVKEGNNMVNPKINKKRKITQNSGFLRAKKSTMISKSDRVTRSVSRRSSCSSSNLDVGIIESYPF